MNEDTTAFAEVLQDELKAKAKFVTGMLNEPQTTVALHPDTFAAMTPHPDSREAAYKGLDWNNQPAVMFFNSRCYKQLQETMHRRARNKAARKSRQRNRRK